MLEAIIYGHCLRIPAVALVLGLVCLATTWGQTPVVEQPAAPKLQLPDAIVTSQTQFDIPFNTDDQAGRLIEVQLYVSTDLGKSWNLYARQAPQARKIPFQSVGDGEYLFALKTLDRDRRLLPTGPPIPTLRIAVDTQRPELQLQIDPDKDGRIATSWRAMDANLDRRSLELSYRIAETNAPAQWIPVPTGRPHGEDRQATADTQEDRVVWWPDTAANAIVLKAEIKDFAGNVATVFQPVGLSAYRPTPVPTQLASDPAAASQGLTPPDPNLTGDQANKAYKPRLAQTAKQPESGPITWPVDSENLPDRIVGNLAYQRRQDGNLDGYPTTRDPFQIAAQRDEAGPDAAHDQGIGNMTVAQGTTWGGQPGSTSTDPRTLPERSRFIPQSALAQSALAQSALAQSALAQSSRAPSAPVQRPPAPAPATSNRTSSDAGMVPPSLARPSHGTVPGRQVESDYISHRSETSSADRPSPLNAEPGDRANRSEASDAGPFEFAPGTYFSVNQKRFRVRYHVDGLSEDQIGSVAIFGSTDMGKHWRLWTSDNDRVSPVPIEVPTEGRYAFRVVVTNLGGLASDIPASGTPPELVVDVDLTAPTPRITAAPYGRNPRQATLNIQWQCPDQDLIDLPIAIAYSDSPQGPWTTITQAAPNRGEFAWQLQPNLPGRVYLRMAATDKAGNRGFYQLPEPVNLAPLIPHGRILGLEK